MAKSDSGLRPVDRAEKLPRTPADEPNRDPSFECVAKLVHDLGSTLDLDEVLQRMALGIQEHVDYDTFAVLLLDDLGQELHFRFARGFPEEVVDNWRFGIGQGIVGAVVQSGERMLVGDVREDSRYIGASPEVRSEMAIPLVTKNRTIGVLDVGSHKPHHFTKSQQQFVAFLAAHLSSGIENARLYQSVRRQAQSLSLLHESSRELTSILDRGKLLTKVAELVKRLVDYHLFSVMLWNEQTQSLEHAFALGFDERFCKKDGFPLGFGVTGTAAALRQAMLVPNVQLNPHYQDCGHGVEVRSELAVPLVFKDRLVGVIDLESMEYNAFTQQHEEMLSTLGSYIAVALENARLYAKLEDDERRLETDLETAREIQKGLLPDEVPQTLHLDVGTSYQPALTLGGDFYDFLPYGDDRLAFAVGDVAGKGTPAALYGSLAVGILRGHVVEHSAEPAEMLQELDRQLGRHRIDNRYVAMAFGVYDGNTRRLTLANGGFPRPTLVRDGAVEDLAVEGIPLGMFGDSSYRQLDMQLQEGDLVVFCSDGICESSNRNREEFGVRRMQAMLVASAQRSAQQIADELLESAERYVEDAGRDPDDRTVVVLKIV